MKNTCLYLLALGLICAVTVQNTVAAPPNIVVILTDDQGWGDLSLNGNKNLSTPNIDRLAADGAQFDRFYVCPVCSPTRAEFLTGRYHPRSSVFSTSAGGERMDLDEKTIGDTFKAAGYATAAFGKWHNGMQFPYHPNARGFDLFYGFCSGHWGHYFSPMLEQNGRITKGNGFVIDDFTDRAITFMEANKSKPFFAYLPYNTPHSPMQVPDKYWAKFKDHPLPMRSTNKKQNMALSRAARARCENIDWNVGRLLKKIDDLGIAENTIVVYFCDNGPNGWRWNGGMKGKKGSTDEGGVRSPLLVRWPGKIAKGKKVTQISAAIDLLPTLAELAGVKVASTKPLDGVSLKNLLDGSLVEWKDRKIYSHWAGRISIRTQKFRFDNKGKLFDMVADPQQTQDVSKQHPQIAKQFKQDVEKWRKDVLSEMKKGRPFVIGHPASKWTQIPARDGKAHGGIKRSNRFPNDSFFLNWKKTEDKITWDVEVGATGKYKVDLYYTCPKQDVGATFELRYGDEKIESKITEAHDPPLVGAKEDRSKRQESYVKDFKAMTVGTIQLNKGKGTLTLQATKIPGGSVMDFRLLMLERVDAK
jgi:arylsulfatase A-like enzyme